MTHHPNLMVHCGGLEVDREDLYECVLPKSDTHVPIPHGQLLDEIIRNTEAEGLRVTNQSHALARAGEQYFGVLQVEDDSPDIDFATVVGIRNSHDMSITAGLAVGSCVFVCDNLAFSGEVVIARKHTRHILRDLPALVSSAVDKVDHMRARQSRRIEAYKNLEIAPRRGDALIVEMYRRGIINVQRVAQVVDEWDKPSHDEFAQGHTAWRLFNAATEALKPKGATNLMELPGRTRRLHGLLDELAQIPDDVPEAA